MKAPPLLRTSERKDFRRCPWLWQMHWVEGISPIRAPTWSVFGLAVHKALEHRYPPGIKRNPIEECVEVFLYELDDLGRKVGVDIDELEEEEERQNEAKDRKVKLVPARELGPAMLRHYAKVYGDDKEWECIHTEQTFQINVPDPARKGKVLVVYAGTWDALMRNRRNKRYWLWDHKTAKAIPNPDFLELDDQAGSYIWVAKEVLVHKGLLTKRDRISGIIFNYLKKSLPDPRPTNSAGEALNQNGSVSARQPAPRFLRYPSDRSPEAIVRQARRVQKEAVVMAKMKSGELPIYKNTAHDCPRCILFDMCTAHEQGDDWELLRDELYIGRDPYADHREAMENNGIEL